MNNHFLIDDKFCYTYKNLLDDLCKIHYYRDVSKSGNIYDFYLNLIFGIINNEEIILQDFYSPHLEVSADFNKIEFIETKTRDKSKLLGYDELYTLVKNTSSKFVLFTSGTTGQPKKVTHSIESLSRSVKIGHAYANNIWGLAYNPTHMAGLLVFFQAFFNKCTMINLFNKPRTYILEAIEKYNITNISATPTFYRLLLPFEKQFLNVSRITFGGEKSSTQLHETIQEIFPKAKINNIYASTEAGSLFISNRENFLIPEKIKEMVMIDNGELLIHKSLLGNSESFKLNQDSYYRTGDIVEWVDQSLGLFKFYSRKNELINVGGYKINPLEVEEVIQAIPSVKNVFVYGKINSVLGNILCSDIELHENSQLEEHTLRIHLSKVLQNFKIPRKIKFVKKIELTNTGKLKRI